MPPDGERGRAQASPDSSIVRDWQSFARKLVSRECDAWRRPRIAGFMAPEIESPIEGFPKRLSVARADFVLGRLGCRRCSHLALSAFGTETFSRLNDLLL
jgi:hypothetical protein